MMQFDFTGKRVLVTGGIAVSEIRSSMLFIVRVLT
jgi:hypothetical protein